MSLPRHEEIYRSDGPDLCRSGAQSERLHAPTYRLDEFPAGYSLAGCAPAEPASASPAEEKFTMKAAPQPTLFQRMGKPCLTGCLTAGVHPSDSKRPVGSPLGPSFGWLNRLNILDSICGYREPGLGVAQGRRLHPVSVSRNPNLRGRGLESISCLRVIPRCQ